MHRSPVLLAALAALGAAPAAEAQNVVLDEGTFEIRHGDRVAGTESFTIRRVGSGADARIVANAVVELELPTGSREMRPLLQTGADMSLSAYQIVVTGDQQTEIRVESRDRRLVAHVRSAAGEMEREYRAVPGAVLLEEGVVHQYWFLGERAEREGVAIPVMVPRTGEQGRMTVRSIGEATVTVGGSRTSARRISFTLGSVEHELWVDGQGRVLRVEIPSTGWSAVRTTP